MVTWLLILLFLLCPLAMMLMMRGHHHGHGPSDTHQGYTHEEPVMEEPSRLDIYKMKQLDGHHHE